MTRFGVVVVLAAVAAGMIALGVVLVIAEIGRLRRLAELETARAESEGFAHGVMVGSRQIGIERADPNLELELEVERATAAVDQLESFACEPGDVDESAGVADQLDQLVGERSAVDSPGRVDDAATLQLPPQGRDAGAGMLAGGAVSVEPEQLARAAGDLLAVCCRLEDIADDLVELTRRDRGAA